MSPAVCPPVVPPPSRPHWRDAPAGLLVFLALLPLAAAAIGSLAGPGGGARYVQWWGTARGWEALWRTVQLAFLAAAAAVLLAWALAASVVRWSARAALPVALLSCLPMLIPSSALATAWIVAMGPQGRLGSLLQAIGLELFSLPAAAAVLALRYFGIAVAVLTYQQVRQLGHWPAERVFGVPRVVAAVRLHLQPSLRATAVAGLLVMLLSMNDHIVPELLLVSTYGPQVMIQYSAMLDPAGAAALAIPVAGVGVVLVGLALWSGQAGWTGTGEAPAGREPGGSVARRLVAAGLTVVILAAALATPVVVLARQAGRWQALPEAIWDARRQLRQTLYYVALGSPACAALAAVLAGHWVRCRRSGRFSAAPLVLLNLTIPPALLAIGVIELMRTWPLRLLRDPSWQPVVAYVARFLPVATLAFYTAWRNDSPLLNLAARVHGAGRWRTAWRVSWPRRRWEALAVALLCGVLIATELEMSILLAPPGGATLGIRLYTLIHTAPDSVVSALTLAILALVGPGIALLMLLLSRDKRQGGTVE